jgi:C-terminal processing protease CtpA/Prc
MRELNTGKGHKRTILWVLTFINTLFFIKTTYAQPAYYTEKIYSIPDLTQTDKRADFPGGGTQYCCLVAIANSLMWMDSNGFPDLVQNSGNLFDDEVKLVKLLGSKAYMDTSLEYGTGTTKLMRGIKKYVQERGYEIKRLEYQGWRKHPPEMRSRLPVPRLSWIKQSIVGKGAVWLNVGWYDYNRSRDEYTRIAGHWVTLVGYGKDENGRLDPTILILHDPSPRAGKSFRNEYASVSRIRRGKLVGEWVGLPRSAAGYYKLGGGMHIKREANSAVIDGVIALELKPTNAPDNIKQPGTGSRTSSTAPSKLNPLQARQKFTQARNMLKGENKDTQQARAILVDLAQNHALLLTPADRCHMYVYLGYIEDLAGSREAAVGWYRRASDLDGPKIEGIRAVAQQGLTSPVTRIRHLDSGSKNSKAKAKSASGRKNNVIERIGKGFVLRDEPEDGVLPKMNLSKAERLENFDILAEAIDRYYSFFVHKGIDFKEVKSRYRPRIEMVRTTKGFYNLIYQFVMELKDFHSWLCNYKDVPSLGRFSPQISTRLIEGKAVVTEVVKGSQAYGKGLRPGSVIIAVDGSTARSKVTKMRRLMHMYSSKRCFLEQAYRRILDGEKGSTVSVRFRAPGRKSPATVRLRRVSSRKQEVIQPDFHVNKGKFIWYGIHPSGCGYIRILSFKGRLEIADEFDRALERLKDTHALIIDVRENPGGFGTAQARIVGRFIANRTKVHISYTKSGPGHKDFKKQEGYFGPVGDWQYKKPIALLMNAITGSACDFFACRMISTGRAVTIGTTTHGNLTGGGVYVVMPCQLVVRVSSGYVCDASGRIIEVNGSVPQVRVEYSIADIVNGTDPVIERAVQTLRQKR